MKKNIKVVEINGLKGIFVIIYAIVCAIAGFVVFPSWGLMTAWNYFAYNVYPLPIMNLFHGFLLYIVLVLLYLVLNSNKNCINITSSNFNKSHIAAMMNDIDDEE